MTSPDSSELDRAGGNSPTPDAGQDVSAETQALFLGRLRGLLERRYNGAKLDDDQQRLLDRAIYSTFCDCLELGLSEQARSLIRAHQAS